MRDRTEALLETPASLQLPGERRSDPALRCELHLLRQAAKDVERQEPLLGGCVFASRQKALSRVLEEEAGT
ncbi:hypothetical protein Q5P01_004195 [Channa striata]|uniref:Uncharacterized protein n=1 Tax=Channa striata TaxID=64152 RepID=A0AA88T3E4_CHASR|nr:hypothetical protein Q5P01_004195 [Channa striata]